MEYAQLPGIKKPLSRLVMGTDMVTPWEEAAAFRLLDAVYEQGARVFDTAHIYGNGANERRVGRWLRARARRDEVVLLAKGAHHDDQGQRVTPADIRADIQDSLARFQTDHLDLYLLHRDDPSQPVGPIVECLHEHAEAGIIGAYGGSNWTTARLQAANEHAAVQGLRPFVASSPNFSLADQFAEPWPGCVSLSGAARARDLAWYRDSGMALFAWSSLAGGFFSGRLRRANAAEQRGEAMARCLRVYGHESNWQRQERARELGAAKGLSLPQTALAYVLSQECAVFPLVGCQSAAEFAECRAALSVRLTREECRWLEEGV